MQMLIIVYFKKQCLPHCEGTGIGEYEMMRNINRNILHC